MSEEERRLYGEKLKEFRVSFRKVMLDPKVSEVRTEGGGISWNTMDLWATSILMEEAITLSRLTKWLIVLTIVLAALTTVLAYSTIRGLHP